MVTRKRRGCMRLRSVLILTLFVSSILIAPAAFSAIAASAPPRIVFSFAGLNERTGILFVGKDRGFFQKHGLDGQEGFVRSGQLGVTALSAGESQFHVGGDFSQTRSEAPSAGLGGRLDEARGETRGKIRRRLDSRLAVPERNERRMRHPG